MPQEIVLENLPIGHAIKAWVAWPSSLFHGVLFDGRQARLYLTIHQTRPNVSEIRKAIRIAPAESNSIAFLTSETLGDFA